jgi:hypothetical protein
MDAIRNVRNAERIGSPSADNSATAQKKRRPSAKFCKHRSWILANTSEIQHNAGTVERTETHTQKRNTLLLGVSATKKRLKTGNTSIPSRKSTSRNT